MTKLGFGKHADDDITEVPEAYLQWLVKNSQEKIDMCESELKRRLTPAANSTMAEIVRRGYEAIISVPGNDVPKATRARDALMKAIMDAAGAQ